MITKNKKIDLKW